MTRDLDEALARFDAAANPRITYRGLDWPEFERFLSACATLERRVDQFVGLTTDLDRILLNLRYARRRLRTIPISPSTESLGLLNFARNEQSSFGSEIDLALAQCRNAALELIDAGDHPAVSFLKERIARVRNSISDCTIHSVVSRDCLSEMELINDLHGFDLIVSDLVGAKRVDTGEVCFILGSPESLHGIGLNWMDRTQAARAVAWLFNAPIAREVCVVSWPGNPAFKVDRYEIFPDARLHVSSSTGRETFNIESTAEFASRASEAAPIPTDQELSPTELVSARAIQLAGGIWVFYAIGPEGPRPDRIFENDFNLTVEDVTSLSQLKPGDRLVIRDGDASRRFLDREADRWLKDRFGKDEAVACRDVRERFRAGMQSLERTADAVSRLRTIGLTDQEINYRFRLSHDRAHIAPESFSDFEKLSKACGYSPSTNDWDHIRHLRSALKRAGRIARSTMEHQISMDDTWIATVDIPDAARVDMGELGSLVISRVLQILPDPVLVPMSRLGLIQRSAQ